MARPDDSQPPDSTEIKASVNFHKDAATLDQYRLIECIGEGSFGQVWKAIKGDAEVALKILKTSMTSEETQRELKSLQVLQELKHKYLVQTYDFWSNGDQLFIEMELANGGSLKDRLKAWQSVGRKGVPEGELLKYFCEIAEALDYLHGQRPRRFLHRDVKPANILLVGGSAKLADFGLLRKVAGDNTGTKTQGGTPVFMAPESIKSDVFSPRTDLYSLAVTYAELRQGKLPFSGSTEYQVCNNILSSLPELSDELYPGEREALLKALDKDPNNRYVTCGEFAAALKEALPVKEADAPGEATVLPGPSTTMIDAGTAPRNAFRRAATTIPRPAAETQAAVDAPVRADAPDPAPTGGAKTPLFVAIALLILAGMGVGIGLYLNQAGPDHVPVTRRLDIKTTPAGATVYIDDKPQEQKTNGAFEVPVGPFQLRLALAGHKDFTQHVGPKQSAIEEVLETTKPLPPALRKLAIATDPPGAIVYIGAQRQTQLTNGAYDVPDAPFHLRLVLAGHKDVDQSIARGKDKLEFKLEPISAPPLVRKMEIKSTPAGAAVFIDGKEQAKKTNGSFEVPVASFKLRLEMPDHDIIQQTIGPKETELHIVMAKTPAIPSRMYALLIGVNQPTKQLPDFLHAEADVAELGRTLLAGGMQADDLQVLTQGNEATLPIAERIRQALANLVKNKKATDTVVVALVGHVVAFSGEPGSYFCPAECVLNVKDKNSLIPLDEIFQQLQSCKARNKLVLLDGWRTDLFPPLSPADGTNFLRDRAKELAVPTGVAVFASCSAEERGNPHPLLPHGLFVQALLRGLRGAADVTPNRQIGLEALVNFTTREVSDTAQRDKLRQTPELLGGDAVKPNVAFTQTDVLLKVHEGAVALEQKKYDQALAAFNDAEGKNSAYLEIYTGRALAHYFKGKGQTKDDASQYDRAIQDCRRVLKADPRNVYVNGYLAQIAALKAKRGTPPEKAKEFQRALQYHEREMDLDPQWAMAFNSRGVTYAAHGDYALAIKDYTEAIRLNPKLKFPYENRGFAFTAQKVKDYDRALADFSKAIDLNPANALNYYRRGGVYRAKGQFEHALEDLTVAIKLDPTNANSFYSRALVQVARKDFDKAIEDFTQTLNVAKAPDRETLYGRGYAYNEKGFKEKNSDLYDKAIQDLTEALNLSPKYVLALYVRGVAYQNKAHLKNNDEKLLDLAIADFNQAIEQNPEHAKSYYGRGLAYQAKGQTARGEADIKKARQIDPNVDR